MLERPDTITRRAVTVAALAALVATGACKETAAPDDEGFTILPDVAEIFIGDDLQLTAIGAPSTPAWASSNSQVATVVTETGHVIGVGRGTATISAVAGGAVASIEVTVLRPPALALAQPTVDFFMDVGGSNPANQTVVVSNAGDGTLSGINVQGITYGPNNPAAWLSVSPSGDTAPVTLTLGANGQALARGVYTATVQLEAPGVENSPQSLAVMLHVQRDAEITVSPTVVSLAGIPGAVIEATVDVTNAGDKTLDGLAVAVMDPPGSVGGWLAATLDATTAPTTIRLAASTGNLPVGNYSTVVRVTSTAEGVSPVNITVDLVVSPGPAIALSSTTAAFQANTGQNPGNQTVTVTNAGGGSLTGLGLGTITYGAGQPAGWLTATIGATTAPATITLSVLSSTLPQGTYTATVPVQSAVASNSPAVLTVSLNVGPPPIINLNPNPLLFLGWTGGTLPATQGSQVTNAAVGGGPLPGLSYTVSYGTGATGWLEILWQGNVTSAPTTLLLRPNTTALPNGSYTATITVSTTVPGVAAQTLTITYQMRAFSVEINPSLGSCLGSGCHSASRAPDVSSNFLTNCSRLQSFLIPGDGFNSRVYRKLAGLISHTGGSNWGTLPNTMRLWIDRGAPCS